MRIGYVAYLIDEKHKNNPSLQVTLESLKQDLEKDKSCEKVFGELVFASKIIRPELEKSIKALSDHDSLYIYEFIELRERGDFIPYALRIQIKILSPRLPTGVSITYNWKGFNGETMHGNEIVNIEVIEREKHEL